MASCPDPEVAVEDRLRGMELDLQLFISNNLRKQDSRNLRETLKYDIPPADMENCHDFNDMWNHLYTKGLLKLGSYDYLKQRCNALQLDAISGRIDETEGCMKRMKSWSPGIRQEAIVDITTFYEQLSDLADLKRLKPRTTLDQINHPNAVAAVADQDMDRALHLKDKFSLLIPKQAVQGWLVVYCHFDFSNGLMTEDSLLRYEPPGQDIVWYCNPITCGPPQHKFQHPVSIVLGHCADISERFHVETLEIYLKRVDGDFQPIGPKKCIFEKSGFVIIETDHFSTYCVGVEATKTKVLPLLKLAVLASIRGSTETGLYIDLMVLLDSEYMVQMACEKVLAAKVDASFFKSNQASFLAKPSVDLVLVVTDGSQSTPNSVTIPQQVLKTLAFKPVLLSKPIVKSGNDCVCGVVIKQEEPVFAFNILPKTCEMKEVSSRLPSPSSANTQADRNTCFAPTMKLDAPSPCTGQKIEDESAAMEKYWEQGRGMEMDDADHSDRVVPPNETISTCSIDHDASSTDVMRTEEILAVPLVKEKRSFTENTERAKDLRFEIVYEELEAKLCGFYQREKEELKKIHREDITNMKTSFEKQISALEKYVKFWKNAANKAEGIEREKFKAQFQDLSIQLKTRSLDVQEDEERMRKVEAECADQVAKLEAQLQEQRTEAEKTLKKVTEATSPADEVQRIEGLEQDQEAIVSMSNIQSNESAVSNTVDQRLSRIESLLEEKFKMAEELKQRLEVEEARYLYDKNRLISEGVKKLQKLQKYHEEQRSEVERRYSKTVNDLENAMDERERCMMKKNYEMELQVSAVKSECEERIKKMTREYTHDLFMSRGEKQQVMPNTAEEEQHVSVEMKSTFQYNQMELELMKCQRELVRCEKRLRETEGEVARLTGRLTMAMHETCAIKKKVDEANKSLQKERERSFMERQMMQSEHEAEIANLLAGMQTLHT